MHDFKKAVNSDDEVEKIESKPKAK
ncbi:hypothetical protein [Desulforamulus ruminis]